jgi:lipoate---protein ligase
MMAERLAFGERPVVILADPLAPFLSVGANQNIVRDIDLPFCCEHSIPVIRRRLGGGAFYIDRDQLIFHVVVPGKHAPWPFSPMLSTSAAAVAATLRDFGIAARLRPRGDVVVDGRKIAGTAGAEICGKVIVGGTFVFDFDALLMACCLRLTSERYRTRVAKLFERGMTTIRRELGEPPARGLVKARFIANLARCLDAEPREIGPSTAGQAAIAAETLEALALHG